MNRKIYKWLSILSLLLVFAVGPASAATIAYTYDAAGRLTKADYGGGKTIAYTYDNNGNLLQMVVGASTDTSPDAFTFNDQTGVALNTQIQSNQINVGGIDAAAVISITNCSSALCQYSINGGNWVSAAETVSNGDKVIVRQTSSSNYGTQTDLTLTIGGISDTFSVTTLAQRTLNVTKSVTGTGKGTVTSVPAGINCGSGCSANYAHNTLVTLTATAGSDSIFAGWSGDADCSDGRVTMSAVRNCTATFNLNRVVSIPSATGRGPITLETNSPGCGFYNYGAKTEAQAGNDPSYNYPYGLVEFILNCEDAEVTITFPGDISGMKYRKYGPTPPAFDASTWYDFPGTPGQDNTKIVLHLVNGQLGDDTDATDNIIVDQGGPGQPGEDNSVAVPTMTEWGMIVFTLLAGSVSLRHLRRKRPSARS